VNTALVGIGLKRFEASPGSNQALYWAVVPIMIWVPSA